MIAEPNRPRNSRGVPVALAALALAGTLYGLAAAVGETCYFQSRYGCARGDLARTLAWSRTAAACYPFDYYVSIWAGKQAFHGRHDAATPAERDSRVEAATYWARRGYGLNPYNSESVQLWADVLALSSPSAALAVWEPYVQRHFWDPFNHVFLVDLYLRADELEKAEASLYWAQKSNAFQGLRDRLDAAWRARRRGRG